MVLPLPLVAASTSSAWLPYLLAIGAGGTYAMNRDRFNRMAGSFNFPWSGYQTDAEFLAGSSDDSAIPWNELGVNRQNYLLNEGAIEREEFEWGRGGQPLASNVLPISISAAPGATNSEFDERTIVTPVVETGGGNGGNGGGDDDKFMSSARWTALGEIPSVFSRLFDKASDVDPYEAGRIEREEQEWGPGGQPSASDQIDTYERSKWLQKTRNSPAQRSGAFSDDELWALQKQHRAFKDAQSNRTMDEFVEAYPQSQTAKERAIQNRIPSSLDMEF